MALVQLLSPRVRQTRLDEADASRNITAMDDFFKLALGGDKKKRKRSKDEAITDVNKPLALEDLRAHGATDAEDSADGQDSATDKDSADVDDSADGKDSKIK